MFSYLNRTIFFFHAVEGIFLSRNMIENANDRSQFNITLCSSKYINHIRFQNNPSDIYEMKYSHATKRDSILSESEIIS